MRRLLPDGDRCRYLRVGLVSFGVGILLTFFLSVRVLVMIEAVLLIIAGINFFTEG